VHETEFFRISSMSSPPYKQMSSQVGYPEIPVPPFLHPIDPGQKYRSPYGPKYKTQLRLFSLKFDTLFTAEKAVRW
jgi:hypothetical protein